MRQIFVDSRDRIKGTPCDFSIELKRTLVTSDRIHRMRVDHLRLPIAAPTITTSNNTLIIQIGSTNYTITMPAKNYDNSTLISTLQSQLALIAPGSWTVTYDTTTISMTILCNNPFTVIGGTWGDQLLSRPWTYSSTASVSKWRFSYVPLNGADVLFLCSDQFSSTDIHGPSGSHDTILVCNVTAPYGSVQEFNMSVPDWIECPALSTNTLSFQLRDRNHNLLSDYVPNISFLLTID